MYLELLIQPGLITSDLAAMLLQYLIADAIRHKKSATCAEGSENNKCLACKKEPQLISAELNTLSIEHN